MSANRTSNALERISQWIVPAVIAVGCLALGLSITTDTWAEWFQHPAREPMPETTLAGAMLWRVMLFVAAGAWVLLPSVLPRFARPNSALALEPLCRPQSNALQLDRRRVGWVLVMLVLIGFALRATRITESLWYDEIAAFKQYAQFSPGVIIGNYFDPSNHIAHTLLTWLSVGVFGDHALALRLPALVFSLLSILTVYALAREVISQRVALLSAGLVAVLPVSVLEGVEARGYSMMIALAAASTWLWLAACRRPRARIALSYVLVTALGIWAHPLTAFVAIGHGLWLAWATIRQRNLSLFMFASLTLLLAAVTTVMLYAPVLPDMFASGSMFARTSADQPSVFGAEGLHALLQLGGSWYGWAALPGLTCFAIGLVRSAPSHTGRTLFAMTLLGGLFMVAVLGLGAVWMYARFLLFVLPGAIVFIAIGLICVWQRTRTLALLLCGLIVAASAVDLLVRPPKQPLRDAMQIVHAQSAPGTRVLAVGLAHRVLDVYAGNLNLRYSLFHGRDINAALTQHEPAWIVLYYPDSVDDDTYHVIGNAGFRQVARLDGWVDWSNGDVLVYRRFESRPRN